MTGLEAYEPFVSLGTALACGLLIGLERERSQTPDSGSFVGGIRTHPLVALLGALSVSLSPSLVPWFPVAAFLGVLALVAIAYHDDVQRGRDRGLTGEVSFLVTFILGVVAASPDLYTPLQNRVVVVGAIAVIVTFLLSAKPWLRVLVSQVSADDLYATIKFLIVLVVALPLLPNEDMGPLSVLNPFKIGLMIVLIAGIGFVGYVASRIMGPGRGLFVTAMVGGLVSSTAVTLSFAARSKAEPRLAPTAAVAIIIACTIMFLRILVAVFVVSPALGRALAVPVAAMAVAGLLAGALSYRHGKAGGPQAPVPVDNPFELSTAFRFGLVFALVLLASKAAQVYAGASGMYAAAALAGTTDVDAIVLSTASLANDGLDLTVATTIILIGATSNTLVKTGMAAVLGGAVLGKRVAAASVGMLLAGAAAVVGMGIFSA